MDQAEDAAKQKDSKIEELEGEVERLTDKMVGMEGPGDADGLGTKSSGEMRGVAVFSVVAAAALSAGL